MPDPETVAAFTSAAFFVRYYHRPHQATLRAPYLAQMAAAAAALLAAQEDPETVLNLIADTLNNRSR